MFSKLKPALAPNTYAFESEPLAKPPGFREYGALAAWQRDQSHGCREPRHGTRHPDPAPLAAVRAAIKSAAHLREMTNAGKNFCCTGG
jgi:hypothetical protein